jgi:hypothetical protein
MMMTTTTTTTTDASKTMKQTMKQKKMTASAAVAAMIAPPPIDPDHHDHDKKEVVKVSLKIMVKGRLIVSDDDCIGAPPHKKKMEAASIERLARAAKACALEGAEHGQKSKFRLSTARLGEISFLLIQQIHTTDARSVSHIVTVRN